MGETSGDVAVGSVFPCHPTLSLPPPVARWQGCPECGSLLDRRPGRPPRYDESYARQRGHFDPVVGRCKVRSLDAWLRRLGIDPAPEVVCEIGFGAGWCLSDLRRRGSDVMGLEPNPAARAHAVSLGVPAGRVFDVEPLPSLPRPPSLWLFQDSFEHVPDPTALLRWIGRESAGPVSRVLLVAPDGSSWSRRLLGRFWLHNSPDHWIHYTRRGVIALFEREGFRPTRRFHPVKCLGLGMAAAHLGILYGLPARTASGPLSRRTVWFNVGEMGLLLEKHATGLQAAS